MFQRTNNTLNQNKSQEPVPQDENVREEALQEANSIQPMGNEAANVEFYTNMLREANKDNMLDLSGYEDQEKVIVPYNNNDHNLIMQPGADDPNNSMYLESSHNIVNDNNFINGVNVKDLQS